MSVYFFFLYSIADLSRDILSVGTFELSLDLPFYRNTHELDLKQAPFWILSILLKTIFSGRALSLFQSVPQLFLPHLYTTAGDVILTGGYGECYMISRFFF